MVGMTTSQESDAIALWQDALTLLAERNVAPATLAMLRSCQAISFDGEKLTVSTNMGFAQRKISQQAPMIEECLEQAERLCAAADVSVQTQSRLAVNFVNGVIHAFRENDASEIIIGLHRKRTPSDSLLGRFAQGLIDGLRRQVTIVHYNIPVSMVRRIVVAIPESAEYESGFHRWVERLARLSLEIGCAIHFYGEEQTCERIRLYLDHHHKGIRADYFDFDMGDGLDQLASEVNDDHLLVVVSARQGTLSYRNHVNKLQPSLKAHFSRCNLMIIFPDQSGENEEQSTFSQPLVQEKYEPPAITKWLSKYISKIG